jgi:hypothetical protein
MPVPSSISRQQYAFFNLLLLAFIDSMQADVSKVITIREGPEGLTKEEIDANLLN